MLELFWNLINPVQAWNDLVGVVEFLPLFLLFILFLPVVILLLKK